MLEYFIGKVHEQSMVPLPRPRVIIGLPTGVTEVEKRAVYDAVMASGARQAMLIEEPIAAALGAGLPIGEVRGSMVVDIGGGTTEVAVMSMSGVVASRSLRVAGDEMDQDIVQYLRNKYNVTKAYTFVGYKTGNEALYTKLQEMGYVVILKPTLELPDGTVKGNVDAELVLHSMIEYINCPKRKTSELVPRFVSLSFYD